MAHMYLHMGHFNFCRRVVWDAKALFPFQKEMSFRKNNPLVLREMTSFVH